MPGQSPPSDLRSPSPESVRRSLRSLADGSAASEGFVANRSTVPDRGDALLDDDVLEAKPSDGVATDFEETVRDAERAVACARAAATFLADGRLPVLERAVAAAARRDAGGLERRGRRALAALRRLDAALCGEPADGAESANGAELVGGDHFRSARGTVIRRREKGTGR